MFKFYILNKNLILICALLWHKSSFAFIAALLEAKKEVEGYTFALKYVTDTVEELGGFKDVEKEYTAYEKELREFQKTLNEYEKMGIDVRDFVELRNYDSNSLKGQIDFFRKYIKRTHKVLKNIQSVTGSPETITASEQMETNKTLRALLEDSQTKELRRLRKEIAAQKILLERRKKEQEFINKQYDYINRHSKRKGFGVFHPFQNSKETEGKRKKFLGIF